MKRIYVAGAYSGEDIPHIQANMRRGLTLGYDVLKAGFAPFIPWLDWQIGLVGPVSRKQCLEYSMTWLRASEAVIVVPDGAFASLGTQAELVEAERLTIPVFWTLNDLIEWGKL